MITLYDADRCPYCARVRIVLAEKSVPYETVVIDLADRPAWLYEKNPQGRVPVLEEDGLCIPESTVIMELLEERFPSRRSTRRTRPSGRSLAWRSGGSTTSSHATTTRRAAVTTMPPASGSRLGSPR